jgi:hypothetical protein
MVGSPITAWRDGFNAIARMGTVAGVSVLLMLVLVIINSFFLLPPPEGGANFRFRALTFLVGLVKALLLTPLAIAVHRYVLLGEITRRYSLDPSDPRFVRFFGFSVGFAVLWQLPLWLMGLMEAQTRDLATGLLTGIAFVLLVIVTIIIGIRSIILFPAVAVDAPGAMSGNALRDNWGNAVRDSKGHSWRLFFIALLTLLPAIVVIMTAYFLASPGLPSLRSLASGLFVGSVMNVVTVAVMAAMASRLYAAYGRRLGRPPDLARARMLEAGR